MLGFHILIVLSGLFEPEAKLPFDNDSFDHRNVDQLNKLNYKKILIFYLFILINQNNKLS